MGLTGGRIGEAVRGVVGRCVCCVRGGGTGGAGFATGLLRADAVATVAGTASAGSVLIVRPGMVPPVSVLAPR